MARVKRGFKARRRRNKVLKAARGYYLGRSSQFRMAQNTVMRAWAYAFAGRKQKKRQFRALWITRINAAARQIGSTYSAVIRDLTRAGIEIDRKVLADLAVSDPAGFKAVVDSARAA